MAKPALDKDVPFVEGHPCGVCRRDQPTALATKILTARFGSWEDIAISPDDGTRWLCLPCAWLYRAKDLRRDAIIVTTYPSVVVADARTIRGMLDRPIAADTAVIVPTSGKRIVAPRATWGALTTDRGPLRWTRAHHRLLSAATALRALGATEGALADPSPPWWMLSRVAVTDHARVHDLWRALAPAREDKTMLPLYQRLSREAS